MEGLESNLLFSLTLHLGILEAVLDPLATASMATTSWFQPYCIVRNEKKIPFLFFSFSCRCEIRHSLLFLQFLFTYLAFKFFVTSSVSFALGFSSNSIFFYYKTNGLVSRERIFLVWKSRRLTRAHSTCAIHTWGFSLLQTSSTIYSTQRLTHFQRHNRSNTLSVLIRILNFVDQIDRPINQTEICLVIPKS